MEEETEIPLSKPDAQKRKWSNEFVLTITAIFSLSFGTLFGTGLLWKMQETDRELARDKENRLTDAVQLRSSMQSMLLTAAETMNNETLGNAERKLVIEVIRDDLISAEKRLSLLEQRTPRPDVFLKLVPTAPSEVRLKQ